MYVVFCTLYRVLHKQVCSTWATDINLSSGLLSIPHKLAHKLQAWLSALQLPQSGFINAFKIYLHKGSPAQDPLQFYYQSTLFTVYRLCIIFSDGFRFSELRRKKIFIFYRGIIFEIKLSGSGISYVCTVHRGIIYGKTVFCPTFFVFIIEIHFQKESSNPWHRLFNILIATKTYKNIMCSSFFSMLSKLYSIYN